MKNMSIKTAICAMALVTSSAFAGEVGLASEADVKLNALAADDFAYANQVNPQGNAGSSGFDAAFAQPFSTPWEKIAKVAGGPGYPVTYENTIFKNVLSFGFTLTDGKNGTWSVTNLDAVNNITLDLVFAMHVGGGSGAWLFDNQFIGAGETLTGTWQNQMVNGARRRVTDFSNLTFFGRDLVKVPEVVDVPEPATLGSFALGLGLVGFMRRRQQK